MKVKDQMVKDVITRFNFHRVVLANRYLSGSGVLNVPTMKEVGTHLLYTVLDGSKGPEATSDGLTAIWTGKGLSLQFYIEGIHVLANAYPADIESEVEHE